MARAFTPKVGHLVTYFKANGNPVPAVVKAVGSINGGIILRGMMQAGTYGDGTTGILRGPIDLNIANVVNTWRPR